jgi:hypothetical protein
VKTGRGFFILRGLFYKYVAPTALAFSSAFGASALGVAASRQSAAFFSAILFFRWRLSPESRYDTN